MFNHQTKDKMTHLEYTDYLITEDIKNELSGRYLIRKNDLQRIIRDMDSPSYINSLIIDDIIRDMNDPFLLVEEQYVNLVLSNANQFRVIEDLFEHLQSRIQKQIDLYTIRLEYLRKNHASLNVQRFGHCTDKCQELLDHARTIMDTKIPQLQNLINGLG